MDTRTRTVVYSLVLVRVLVRICCNTLNSELPLGSEGHDRASLQITLDPVARGSIPRGGGVFPGYPGDLPEDSSVEYQGLQRFTHPT